MDTKLKIQKQQDKRRRQIKIPKILSTLTHINTYPKAEFPLTTLESTHRQSSQICTIPTRMTGIFHTTMQSGTRKGTEAYLLKYQPLSDCTC